MSEASILDCGRLIEDLERDLGISTDTIARALEVDRRTVERWRSNQSEPQGKARMRLGELAALRDQLRAMFGSHEAAREWLHSKSLYLGQFTPVEALRAGRIDRVRGDLDGLASGIYL